MDALGRRLKAARGERTERDGGGRAPAGFSGQGLNIALRLGTELVAAVLVGGGMGWFLDQWLGTWPIFFLIFFMLGAATGFRNVIRLASKADDHSS